MNFGSIGDLAKNAVSSLGGDENKPKDQQPASPEQKWNDVGAAAKEALSHNQERQTKGEALDYKELGQVAMKAAGAYNSEGNKDVASIGKMVAGGLMDGEKKAEEQKPQEQQQPKGEQPEGQLEA